VERAVLTLDIALLGVASIGVRFTHFAASSIIPGSSSSMRRWKDNMHQPPARRGPNTG
jgi:hypothetical protein